MKTKRIMITYISIALLMLVGCEEKTINPVGEVKKGVILTDKADIQEVPSSRDGITLEMEKVQYKPYDKEITLN
ncbi:hypothetical protein, partial [Paenisporosarcina sp.]|uniref:hypothetical protein n=1 Tax=Paenisporosarcina sp. TaxID=1932001 RepID=UPI003C7651B0